MGKYLIIISLISVLANRTFANDEKTLAAIQSFQRAEQILSGYNSTSGEFVAQELLKLLQKIKELGVLKEKVWEGQVDLPDAPSQKQTTTKADFGSTLNGLRVGDNVSNSRIYLNVYTLESPKSKIVALRFIFPEERAMLGGVSREVSVTFFDFKNEGYIRLRVAFNESELSRDTSLLDRTEREYELRYSISPPQSWDEMNAKVGKGSVCTRLRDHLNPFEPMN